MALKCSEDINMDRPEIGNLHSTAIHITMKYIEENKKDFEKFLKKFP